MFESKYHIKQACKGTARKLSVKTLHEHVDCERNAIHLKQLFFDWYRANFNISIIIYVIRRRGITTVVDSTSWDKSHHREMRNAASIKTTIVFRKKVKCIGKIKVFRANSNNKTSTNWLDMRNPKILVLMINLYEHSTRCKLYD